jgi:glyoxylase-like metal-dependent hydrolase (beta-lactamase superfamily II)
VFPMTEIIKIKLGLSNAYLVKDKKSILVDAGSPNEADKILAAVQKAGVSSKDIGLILHTHGHFDHAGSTAELKRKLGVPVAVCSKDAFMLRKPSKLYVGHGGPLNYNDVLNQFSKELQ